MLLGSGAKRMRLAKVSREYQNCGRQSKAAESSVILSDEATGSGQKN